MCGDIVFGVDVLDIIFHAHAIEDVKSIGRVNVPFEFSSAIARKKKNKQKKKKTSGTDTYLSNKNMLPS